jgi:hypothetical protein
MADRVYHRIVCNKCGSELGIVRKNVGGTWLQTRRETTDTNAYSGKCPVCYAPAPAPIPTPVPVPVPVPTPATSGPIRLTGDHDRVYEGVTFSGAGLGGTPPSLVKLYDCWNIAFNRCTLNTEAGGGGAVNIIADTRDVSGVKIVGCTFKPQRYMPIEVNVPGWSGTVGIGVYRDILIKDNVFEPSGCQALSFDNHHYADGNRSGGLTITGNVFKGVSGGTDNGSGLEWAAMLEFGDVTDVVFGDNKVWKSVGPWLNLSYGGPHNLLMERNTFDQTQNPLNLAVQQSIGGMWQGVFNNCTIRGNTFVVNDRGGLFDGPSGSGNLFESNKVIDLRGPGYAGWFPTSFRNLHNTRFVGNTFTLPKGLTFEGCSGITFEGTDWTTTPSPHWTGAGVTES